MTVRLLLTSGHGPAECRIALAKVLVSMEREATGCGLDLDVALGPGDKHGPASAIAVVNVGGWDTHLNQGACAGPLATRLQQLSRHIAAFAQRRREVTIVTISEFGRTVGENRNGGTDHGHATAMLVLGDLPRARGGVWGSWPGLGTADVAVTTDFRELFS